jgi:endoglucanase
MSKKNRARRLTTLVVSCLLTLGGTGTAAAAGWSTSGAKIVNPVGGQFVIAGINWYGFETRDNVAHGMWTKDYKYIVDQIRQYGYNTIRLPFSNAMWESNPLPNSNQIGACPECKGKRARDIMAMIVNYAGSVGLHVIIDNHRSTSGNSAQENGLWYASGYTEQAWIRDWVSVQQWAHGIKQTLGATDTITVNYLASDGFPVVIGYDLRNEPHTPSRKAYLDGSTWGSGDGIDPKVNPNPNPFAPACVAGSTCHDWRLAAERGADTVLGEALKNGWDYPLIFVEGIGNYPKPGGTAASGPYDGYWWGGNLLGVNGNSTNPGAPVVLNAGGNSGGLGPAVDNLLVYSAHDYGPALYKQSWFNAQTCYKSGCSPSSLADVWKKYWAHPNLAGGVNPVWPGFSSYPWGNTGHLGYTQAPIYIGEFGTANADSDLYSTGAGTQGQWLTDMINFVQSSYARTTANDSGVPVTHLNWTYWALNDEDSYALLGANYAGLENPKKEYSFLCFIQQGPLALPLGSGPGQCGSTGALPNPQ